MQYNAFLHGNHVLLSIISNLIVIQIMYEDMCRSYANAIQHPRDTKVRVYLLSVINMY